MVTMRVNWLALAAALESKMTGFSWRSPLTRGADGKIDFGANQKVVKLATLVQ